MLIICHTAPHFSINSALNKYYTLFCVIYVFKCFVFKDALPATKRFKKQSQSFPFKLPLGWVISIRDMTKLWGYGVAWSSLFGLGPKDPGNFILKIWDWGIQIRVAPSFQK